VEKTPCPEYHFWWGRGRIHTTAVASRPVPLIKEKTEVAVKAESSMFNGRFKAFGLSSFLKQAAKAAISVDLTA